MFFLTRSDQLNPLFKMEIQKKQNVWNNWTVSFQVTMIEIDFCSLWSSPQKKSTTKHMYLESVQRMLSCDTIFLNFMFLFMYLKKNELGSSSCSLNATRRSNPKWFNLGIQCIIGCGLLINFIFVFKNSSLNYDFIRTC